MRGHIRELEKELRENVHELEKELREHVHEQTEIWYHDERSCFHYQLKS